MKKELTFVLVALLTVASANAQPPAPVATESGLVQGVAAPGLTIYKGVPFAAPPVGDL